MRGLPWKKRALTGLLALASLWGSAALAGGGGTLADRGGAAPCGDRVESLVVGGRERTYLVHRPRDRSGDKPLPLVIVLHGGGGNHGIAERMTGMTAKADAEGFVVVYPDGTGPVRGRLLTWNAGDCCGYARKNGVGDVAFIGRLIDHLCATMSIDRRRIYIAGMSNGAMLAYQCASRLSEKVTAVAAVGGSMSGREPQPRQPVSLVIVHGTADRHVPYEGGQGKLARWGFAVNDKPVSYAVSFWTAANGCSEKPDREDRGAVRIDRYGGGRDGAEVLVYTVEGGRHAWPGGRKGWALADAPYRGLDATGVIWEFFASHPRPLPSLTSGDGPATAN